MTWALDKKRMKTLNRDMAERENIRDRIRRLNPRALAVNDELDRQLLKDGYRGAIVSTTEDMTREEHEMALLEGFLKEGYPEPEAAKKAKEWAALHLVRLQRR